MADAEVQVRVLGPVEVAGPGGGVLPARLRRLLAVLLVAAGSVVSTDRLVDVLWADDPPEDPEAALHSLVARLRSRLRALPAVALVTASPGYLLKVATDALDATRFERLTAAARQVLADDPAEAHARFDDALALWRGAAYAEFADEEFARPEAARLEELRLSALEDRAEAALAAGRPDAAAAELEAIVAAEPLRERPHRQLVLARYRAGRQADALALAAQYRRRLRDELGLDPSPAMERLETDVLRQDPALEAAVPPPVPPAPAPPAQRPGPAPPPALVGRDEELAGLVGELRPGRLVTLTGPGGVGKTSLALHAAAEAAAGFRDGAVVAELAPVSAAADVAPAVTTALELRPGTGASALDRVVDALTSRELLLVLDNCEHVLDSAAALVDAVRRSCPRVAVLATSRAPLEVTGEQVRVVPTLPAPPQATRDVAGVLDCASVRLFVDRAAAASRAFRLDDATAAHVAEICRRLDGLPLALELAAARMGAMTAADLAVRLSSRFSLLHAGRRTAAHRHRTLRALVDWSYELLDEPSRRAFEVLSVFAGAFSLRDAERLLAAVDGSDTDGASLVLGLVDRSMVGAAVEGDAATYALLDTLRAYGRERLAARGEQERVRRVHAELYTALAVDADRHLFGPGHVAAVERLTAALDELRAAWAWSLEHEPVLAARLVGGMAVYVEQRMSAEVPGWAERTLRAVDDAVPELALVHGVAAAGARFAGDLRRARDHLERGLVLAAATGAPAPTPAYLRYLLSEVALFEGRLDEVDALAAAGAADEAVPVTRMLELMPPLAAAYRGDLDGAVRAAQAVHAAALRRGDETLLGWTTYVLGEVLIDADPARAATLFEEARHRALRHGDRYLAGVSLVAAAALHSRHGDPAAAVPLFRDVVQHWWDVGDWVHQWTTLRNVVDLLVRLRRDDEAAVLHAALTARADVAPLFGADAERMAAAAGELAGRLGDEALAARAREGAALSDADVVALARAALAPDSGLTAG